MANNFIVDKSFQMIRTNTKLTTNMKINVDSELNLYLETFNTNKELSDDKYKHYSISNDSYLEDKIPLFYDGLPSNIAFDVKNTSDKDILYNKYENQFDDLYWSGIKKIEENKFYTEEFEYFAPLYMKYKDIPSNFIIMRVDGPGVYEESSFDFDITTTNKDNFKKEIIEKWKSVKVFDLTLKSTLGNWIDKNFISNERFTETSFEFDSKKTNFSRWYGIDYKSGSYTEKSQFLEDKIWYEQPHFKLEEYITEGYKRNEVIFPNILNLNFLFDDNPATPFIYKKYSLNRYFGFYVDMEKIDALTSYETLNILPNLKIVNNIFMKNTQLSGSTNPFFEDEKLWNDNIDYYIYVKDDLFNVKRVKKTWGYSYVIMSKYDVEIEDINNDKEMDIIFESDLNYNYKNKIVMRNTNLELDRLITNYGVTDLYADLYLINIDGEYHVIEYIDNEYLIRSDYGIKSDNKTLKYWVKDEITGVFKEIHDQLNHKKPLVYDIYRVQFRDVKDFDYNRIDSGFADFDFDKDEEYVDTIEHKLYCVEHRDASEDTVFKVYDPLKSKFPDKRIIASSEYVAGDELYEINKNGLSDIWDKNPSVTKWGFSGSISHADYPYKLNNSNKIGSVYNKTTDITNNIPNIETKTNDFFYRLGTFISGNTDGTSFDYKYFKTQSQSIETDSYGDDDEVTQFDLDLYLKADFDYFDYFFNNKRYINDKKEYVQTQQYSLFQGGSEYNASTTLFKGIKYEIYGVDDIIRDVDGVIEKYLLFNKKYDQYKFSIIADYTQQDTEEDVANTYKYLSNKTREYPETMIKYEGDLGQNTISVFCNDKYKNILIILKVENVLDGHTININNVAHYTTEVIYNGFGKGIEVPKINNSLTNANNFMNKLNDNLINHFYIDRYGVSGYTTNTNTNINNGDMADIESWSKAFAPFNIRTLTNDLLSVKKKSFNVSALKGPKTNIYDKYKEDFDENEYDESFIKEPLATIIEINEKTIEPRPVVHGETLIYEKPIFRYNGQYEPIFKNISLFEPSDFFIVDGSEFLQKKCGSGYEELSGPFSWMFAEYSLNLCDNIYSSCPISMDDINTENEISNEIIIKNFGFDIPTSSKIKGITLSIKKYADDGPNNVFVPVFNPFGTQLLSPMFTPTELPEIYYSSISDKKIKLYFDGVEQGVNKAIEGDSSFTISTFKSYEDSGYWKNTSFSVDYGTNNDLWNTDIDAEILNSTEFGIIIQVQSHKAQGYVALNTANIDCVCVEVAYTIDDISPGIVYTTSIERNVRFDVGLQNFGEVDHLIYSKINENENVLKLKNTKEDKSIYPKIDEFGYSWDKRFIFKSNWDSDYYTLTTPKIIHKRI